jgi:hypothetical protein
MSESVANVLRSFKALACQVLAHPTRIHTAEGLRCGSW